MSRLIKESYECGRLLLERQRQYDRIAERLGGGWGFEFHKKVMERMPPVPQRLLEWNERVGATEEHDPI